MYLTEIWQTELLDTFSVVDNVAVNAAHNELGFRNAEFVWSSESRRDFKLRIEDELFFDTGINLIVGLTGAGMHSSTPYTRHSRFIQGKHRFCLRY